MIRKSPLFLALPLLVLLYSCGGPKKLARKKHTYMESAYKALKEAVNEAEVTILNDTVKVLFPEHLLFQKSSAEINEDTKPLMMRFANALNKYEKTSILINGYTDNTGTSEINNKLSAERAGAARGGVEGWGWAGGGVGWGVGQGRHGARRAARLWG